MKRIIAILTVLALLLGCACADAAETDSGWETKLKAVDGVISVERIGDVNSQLFTEKYIVTFAQPLDWNDPSKGTFPQRVEIGIRDGAEFNVLETNGYALNDAIYASMGLDTPAVMAGDPGAEIPKILNSNWFNVEHRFFGKSRPEDMTNDGVKYWEYHTAENAARDYHRIFTALSPLFGNDWIATGTSRGGQMTNVYGYYYPEDMLVYAAYVAPCSQGPEDPRFYSFLYTEIGNAGFGEEKAKEYRDIILAFQVELMRNKDAFLPNFEAFITGKNLTFSEGTEISQLFDLVVLEFATQYWQYQRMPFEALSQILEMPESTAEEQQAKLMAEFQMLINIQSPMDFSRESFAYPYYINAATTYGQFRYDFSHLREALKAAGLEDRLSVTEEMEKDLLWNIVFSPEQKAAFAFDPSFRDALAESLKTTEAKHLMVFGATDPWISLRVPETDNPNVRVFVHPTAPHSATITAMPEDMQAEAMAVLKEWVSAKPATESQPAGGTADPEGEKSLTTQITAHCADPEEGRAATRNQKLFQKQINGKSLAFLLQKKDGTLEEFIDFAAEQVLEFTPEDEKRISDSLEWLQGQLEKHGLKLPDPGTVTFVKTTGKEATGAAGYTSEGCVFLTSLVFEQNDDYFREIVFHELSHCLSRLFPEYRQALYSLIHFTVLDEDIDMPQEILDQIIANPDVEHHNSTAVFTINGEKKECYLVFLTDSVFEKPGDSFFEGMYTGVVPLGETTVYRLKEVEDFWDVVGRNTDYAEDPEEIMASNFSLAIMHLDDGYESYPNPEILEGIVAYLK